MVAKCESFSQIDLTRLKQPGEIPFDKLLGREQGQLRGELKNKNLLNPKDPQPFHLLRKGLEQRRRRLRPDDRPWMRVERHDCWNRSNCCRPCDHGSHYLLVAEMEPVKHPESADRRPLPRMIFISVIVGYSTTCNPSQAIPTPGGR